jgi:hypothetical protein
MKPFFFDGNIFVRKAFAAFPEQLPLHAESSEHTEATPSAVFT